MIEDPLEPRTSVCLLAMGRGGHTAGPGGWGAVLKYGEHTRELSGHGSRTTEELMTFTAVVRALEHLKRPTHVKVWCYHKVPRPPSGALAAAEENVEVLDADLYRRLRAMAEIHGIEWVDHLFDLADDEEDEDDIFLIPDDEELPADHPYERACDLAYEELVKAEALLREKWSGREKAGAPAKLSLEEALQRFLITERARLPRYSSGEIEGVISTLRWSIDWYADEKARDVRASRIADYLPHFYEVVVHKSFASEQELRVIGRVLRALLDHFRDTGQISAKTAKSLARDVAERIGSLTAVRRFVETLRTYVEYETDRLDLDVEEAEEQVIDEYADITEITETSITFEEWGGGATIGPVELPPAICALAERGWQILLSAARVDGRWILLQVVNGDF